MRVVVIGSKGMLGREVMKVIGDIGYEVIGYDLPELDITRMVGDEIVGGVDWVINCAAYTAVDKAEEEVTKAFEVNAVGAGKVARMCRDRGMKLMHVSTDYVFDGKKGVAYLEEDITNPVNIYGLSKRRGEVLVMREKSDVLIVRTQSLYGAGGWNFVKAILKQVEDGKKELRVVGDQVSCPTNVIHLARVMVEVMVDGRVRGILNISAEGECSWYEFAKAILEERGIVDIEVKEVKTGEFPVKAERPLYSVLSKGYLGSMGMRMSTWREGLREYLGCDF
jgi:dTDP-4-dehydrorhamnose reductase